MNTISEERKTSRNGGTLGDVNRGIYELPDVVDFYRFKTRLYKVETVLLEKMKPLLADARMLDIGIGTGRTTRHYAGLVKEYVGIDFSAGMVSACRSAFSEEPGRLGFHQCDARRMDLFPDESFDYILFSLNGVDTLGHEDRLKVFREVRRVGKKGATFSFSAHNLNHVPILFSFYVAPPLSFQTLGRELRRQWMLKRHNESWRSLRGRPHALIRDGAGDFRLDQYYVRPEEQLGQLEALGFRDIEIYLMDGRKLEDRKELSRVDAMWFYYLCRI